MLQLFLENLIFILSGLVVLKLTILKNPNNRVDSELFIFSWLSIISMVGFKYNLSCFSYSATNSIFFTFLIPIMIFSKNYTMMKHYKIIVFFTLLIVFCSVFKLIIPGTIYFFGIGLLFFLNDVVKTMKSNMSGSLIRILLVFVLTYNLFFLGLSQHPELWLKSNFISVVQYVFFILIIFFNTYILFTNAKLVH